MLWTAAAMLLITAAIVVGLGNLLLPYADRYRPELEQWLAHRLQRDVQVERISAQWATAGPEIDLYGLTLGVEGTQDSIRVPQANLRFDLCVGHGPPTTDLAALLKAAEWPWAK